MVKVLLISIYTLAEKNNSKYKGTEKIAKEKYLDFTIY